MITHVIFDLDGTLVNVVDVFLEVLEDYAKSIGKQLTEEIIDLCPNLTNTTVFLNKYMDSLELKEEQINRLELIEHFIQTFRSKTFKLIPGVEKLVKHLHKNNIPMAIATGNTKRHFNLVAKQFDNFFESGNYFSHTVCGYDDSDVLKKKPNPDVYFVCVNRFQTQPKSFQNVLIVEDSLTGITGAVVSGMKTLLINDRKYCKFETIADKITLIADTFDDFSPESVGLPPYES